MLEDANRDIQRLCQEDLRRRWRQQQLDRVVHAIDDLLFRLEDLNLQGVDRVPAALRERASQILDAVPNREEHECLRIRYRVVPMMDVLFRAQEVLFRLRDPRRAYYEDEDSEEERAVEAAAATASTVAAATDSTASASTVPAEAAERAEAPSEADSRELVTAGE